jgi:hypothetical protein
VLEIVSTKSVSDTPTPSDDQRGVLERKEKITLKVKSTSADQGTPSKGTRSAKRERAKEERMERDHCHNEEKE